MAFGIIIDVPLLTAAFILIYIYRKQIARLIMKIKLPNFVLFFLSSIPFIIFEENINCGAIGCNLPDFLPITLIFLLPIVLVLGLLVKLFHLKHITFIIIIFSIIGVIIEITVGAASEEFQALPPIWFIMISLWTFMSYAFIAVVPLTILLEDIYGF